METQPCWLYFDLEFARCVNPNLDPGKVISAFYDLLNEFCFSTFGLTLDTDSVFELDSTTDEKFSKHVIAKRLGGQYHFQSLAFPNNAQAGYFVKEVHGLCAGPAFGHSVAQVHCHNSAYQQVELSS